MGSIALEEEDQQIFIATYCRDGRIKRSWEMKFANTFSSSSRGSANSHNHQVVSVADTKLRILVSSDSRHS